MREEAWLTEKGQVTYMSSVGFIDVLTLSRIRHCAQRTVDIPKR
jgi:hypothetical protein